MKATKRRWKNMIPEHRDYTFIYSIAILWALSYFVFVPSSALVIVTDMIVISLWVFSTLVGALIALHGVLIRDNLLLERLGVNILAPTPLIYSAIQLSIIILEIVAPSNFDSGVEWQDRVPLVLMGIWLFAFLNKRRRQLKHRVQELKTAPALKIKE